MDYKETHISFLYDDLVKEYGNEQGKQLYALMCKFRFIGVRISLAPV